MRFCRAPSDCSPTGPPLAFVRPESSSEPTPLSRRHPTVLLAGPFGKMKWLPSAFYPWRRDSLSASALEKSWDSWPADRPPAGRSVYTGAVDDSDPRDNSSAIRRQGFRRCPRDLATVAKPVKGHRRLPEVDSA